MSAREHRWRLPQWFRLALLFVAGLLVLDWFGIEVLLEFQVDGEPFVASLFRIETYFLPLGLLLAWIVGAWIRDRLSRTKHD